MQVGETAVDISLNLNYLGVLLDQNLTLKFHILTKTKKQLITYTGLDRSLNFLTYQQRNTNLLIGNVTT